MDSQENVSPVFNPSFIARLWYLKESRNLLFAKCKILTLFFGADHRITLSEHGATAKNVSEGWVQKLGVKQSTKGFAEDLVGILDEKIRENRENGC